MWVKAFMKGYFFISRLDIKKLEGWCVKVAAIMILSYCWFILGIQAFSNLREIKEGKTVKKELNEDGDFNIAWFLFSRKLLFVF